MNIKFNSMNDFAKKKIAWTKFLIENKGHFSYFTIIERKLNED